MPPRRMQIRRRVSLIVKVVDQADDSPLVGRLPEVLSIGTHRRLHGQTVPAQTWAVDELREQIPRFLTTLLHPLPPLRIESLT